MKKRCNSYSELLLASFNIHKNKIKYDHSLIDQDRKPGRWPWMVGGIRGEEEKIREKKKTRKKAVEE